MKFIKLKNCVKTGRGGRGKRAVFKVRISVFTRSIFDTFIITYVIPPARLNTYVKSSCVSVVKKTSAHFAFSAERLVMGSVVIIAPC